MHLQPEIFHTKMAQIPNITRAEYTPTYISNYLRDARVCYINKKKKSFPDIFLKFIKSFDS